MNDLIATCRIAVMNLTLRGIQTDFGSYHAAYVPADGSMSSNQSCDCNERSACRRWAQSRRTNEPT